jgi:hypothetical protein
LPEVPLAPGRYVFHVICHRASDTYDDVPFAGAFTVVWGDYFGTGRMPRAKWGPVLVGQEWQAAEE